MIEYIKGDIFESPAQVIVNTVNTVGVMGKGLALSFKKRYPKMFDRYKIACEKKQLTIGKLMLFYEPDHWLLLFPKKENWRNPSKLEYIEKGLMKFEATYADKNITSIAFPRLGCGNGELDWNDVQPLMERYLKKLPIDVYIYLGPNPDVTPEHKEPQKTITWLRENAKDMSFQGLKDDLYHLSAILSYCYEVDDVKYEMSMRDNLEITNVDKAQLLIVDGDKLYEMWDWIRNRCVFSIDDASNDKKMVCELLYHLGYLSRIKLYDSQAEQMVCGYQVNAGLGRVMGFKEG